MRRSVREPTRLTGHGRVAIVRLLHSPPRTDDALFGELYDRYAPEICRFLFRRTAQWELAEDLVAVVFLEAWRRRGHVDLAHEHVRAWLYGVAVNTLRNHRRAMRRHERALRAIAAARPPLLTPEEVDDRLHDEAAIRQILAAMKAMPRIEQEAVALVAWAGLSYAEAAAAMNVPVGTVRSRLSRARTRLREHLGPTLEEEG